MTDEWDESESVVIARPAIAATPHSEEAEQQVISACLIDEGATLSVAIEAGLSHRSFHTQRPSIIFSALRRLRDSQAPIDLGSLVAELQRRGEINTVGMAYLMDVERLAGTTTKANYFITQVREHEQRREILRLSAQAKERVANASPTELAQYLREQLESITTGQVKLARDSARPITSYAYPSEDDPNILIGKDDYLGKGGGMLFVSHAGAGKSSWIMDACMMWGLGNPWMGIKCARPLKSLIIQAEDSDRYVGKIYTSFAHQNKLTEAQVSSLSENCVIVRLKGVAGQSFYSELKRLTDLHQPDLVIINPLYLYAEGDIGRAEFAQPFLLNLDHINKAEKFAYILIHHTGKPSAKGTNGKRAETEDWESAYMGFGSSYLANWPRCTALLEPVAGVQRRFTIKLGKGGYNAGVTKTVTQGVGTRQEPTTKIHIKHSDERMDVNGIDKPVFYWEECNPEEVQQTEPQDQKRGPKRKHSIGKYLPLIPTRDEAPKGFDQIQKAAHNMSGIPRNSFRDLIDYETDTGILLRSHDPVLGPCYKQS